MVAVVLLLRAVFTLGAFLIVASAVLGAWARGELLLAVAAFAFFPVTFFVYPWIGGLQVLWLVSMAAYAASNLLAVRSADGAR
jgi:hypothetical protein